MPTTNWMREQGYWVAHRPEQLQPTYWVILWQDRVHPHEPRVILDYDRPPRLFTSRIAALDEIRTRGLLVRQRCWIVPLTAGEPEEVTGA